MFVGWYELLRSPRHILALFQGRRPSLGSEDFIMQSSPKHMSLTKPLGSETPVKQHVPQSSVDATAAILHRKDESRDLERASEKEDEKDEAEVMV